jgi:hypothetical protein
MKKNPHGGATLLAAQFVLPAAVLFFTFAAAAQATNTLSDAEIKGRQLARQILDRLAETPAENSTHTGVLKIRDTKGKTSEIPIHCDIVVTATNWSTVYETLPAAKAGDLETLTVMHQPLSPYDLSYRVTGQKGGSSAGDTTLPFAGSDFLVGDLSLEFLYWPEQKILKRETHRTRDCSVLESTNPNPPVNGYSRTVSWVDNESLGIVEAYAYDVNGKKLKDFYPKDFKKVDGQWQVQTLVMENVQTGTRSRLEFDLKK